MGAGDLAPDNAVEASFLLSLCLVNVGDALAKVEVSFTLGLYTSDFHQSSMIVLVGLTSLVSKELSSNIKSAEKRETNSETGIR